MAGDNKDTQREIQREQRRELRRAKDCYKNRIEGKLQQNNPREVWAGLRTITGMKNAGGSQEGTKERADELNLFFNRFDSPTGARPTPPSPSCTTHLSAIPQDPGMAAFAPPLPAPPSLSLPFHNSKVAGPMSSPGISHSLITPPTIPVTPATTNPFINTSYVRRQLTRIRTYKARGPDDISPRVLKICAEQLAGVFTHLFGLSLRLKKVPTLWKTSCVVPVPKKGRPSAPKDFRPVALTSHVMKIFERMVLEHLRPLVRDCLDPLQFAYQTNIGVEDAIICLLHRAYTHLERPQSMVRIMFFDFSSAFDTVQPVRLVEKLQVMKVDPDMVAWISNYLTDRPQYVRLRHCLSDVVTSNTGTPQGTVLSPFLFSLYTSDFCYNSRACHLQKFSDDSSIVGCITDNREEEYRELVENFVGWCDGNHLQLNTGKTKELVVDFRRRKSTPIPVSINGEEVEMVDTYKFLGVHLNNKLDWSDNTEALYRKGQSRLFFLRRLRSFKVCTRLLQMFYQSVVASATFFAVVCWGGGIGSGGASKMNKLVRKASSVVGMKLDCVEAVTERRMRGKLQAIMDNPSHPLYAELRQLRSTFSHRLSQPRASKRLGGSFIPSAIRLYNTSTPRSQRPQSPNSSFIQTCLRTKPHT